MSRGYIHGNVPTQVFVIVPSIPIIFHSTAVAESELDTVKNLFSCTTFILHSMLPIWLAAVKAVQEKRSVSWGWPTWSFLLGLALSVFLPALCTHNSGEGGGGGGERLSAMLLCTQS